MHQLPLLGLFTNQNDRCPYPFIYFNKCKPYPSIDLKPEKGTPFGQSLSVSAIRDLTKLQWPWQRERLKHNRFYEQNNDSACLSHFLYISSLGDLLCGRKSLNGSDVNLLVTFPLAWTSTDRKVPIIGGTLSEIPHAEILVLPPLPVYQHLSTRGDWPVYLPIKMKGNSKRSSGNLVSALGA